MPEIDSEELVKAFAAIETHSLVPTRIICTVCGCVLGMYQIEKPCKHLKELLYD